MSALFDVAVLGAGPAGRAAAARAVQGGAKVAVVDSGPVAALPGATVLQGWTVWGVSAAAAGSGLPFRLDAVAGDRGLSVQARALVLANGAEERLLPFAGWTRPGVHGLAEAAALTRSEPGRRTVLAGAGAPLAETAAACLAAGVNLVAVVDAAAGSAALPGVRWLAASFVAGADGEPALDHVTIAALHDGARLHVPCDLLCVGYGWQPATEAAGVLGAAMEYAPQRGGWAAVLDGAHRTTVPGLYVAGAASGVAGAAAAVSGSVAATAALVDLVLLQAEAGHRELQALLHALAAGRAAPPPPLDPALIAAIPPDCVVCSCEGTTRADIDAALAAGVRDLNQLKQFTRCGMGACQGRRCGTGAAALLSRHSGHPEAAGRFTPRIPLRPVNLAALAGRFDYADIPIPKPAPI